MQLDWEVKDLKILKFFKEGYPNESIGYVDSDGKVVDLVKLYYLKMREKGLSEDKAVSLTSEMVSSLDNFAIIWPELKRLISSVEDESLLEQAKVSVDEIEIKPPISKPSKIIGVALNYRDHAEETGRAPPERPMLFFKSITSIVGHNDYIIIPRHLEKVDYEAELVVVIGRKGRNIPIDHAFEHVLGYTVGNDVSARDIQFGFKNHTLHSWAKSFDTFAPIGPWIVTSDEIGDPNKLDISLRLNGEVMQSSNTENMIFNVAYLVSYVSQGISLCPGDLIFTGTPAGVGAARKPPRFLKSGDVVEINIQGIGTLKNKVILEGELVENW